MEREGGGRLRETEHGASGKIYNSSLNKPQAKIKKK